MKHILTLSFIAVLLASCGGDKKNSVEKILEKNNLEDIRTKRAELVSEQEDFNYYYPCKRRSF